MPGGNPLVVDTDVGGDPDDAIALVLAAAQPGLALVLTTDELGGRRARFARHLLDLLGRADVPVVSGADLGNTRMDCVVDLVPDSVAAQPIDVLAAVAAVAESTDGPIRWAGLGPASNLAAVLGSRPELAERLVVTQMGGAIHYRDPARAEHNFRVDPAAVAALVSKVPLPELVLSDTTFTPEIEITEGSAPHRRLADPSAPAWARLVAAHLGQWFTRFHRGTIQHDALALATALRLPYVDLRDERVVLDDIGRMTPDPGGHQVRVSDRADYPGFLRWLTSGLDAALTAGRTR